MPMAKDPVLVLAVDLFANMKLLYRVVRLREEGFVRRDHRRDRRQAGEW
jgi:hypothetical protein